MKVKSCKWCLRMYGYQEIKEQETPWDSYFQWFGAEGKHDKFVSYRIPTIYSIYIHKIKTWL